MEGSHKAVCVLAGDAVEHADKEHEQLAFSKNAKETQDEIIKLIVNNGA